MQRVTEAWERTCMSECLANRTAAVHQDLHKWDREVLKAPHWRLKHLKEDLEQLRSGPLTDESADRQRGLLIEIEETMEKGNLLGTTR